MHPIPGLNHEIAVGDGNQAVPLHRRIQNPGNAVELVRHVLQGHTHHRVVLLRPELHHFHASFGEGLNVAGEGEAKQPADFKGGGSLRVNGHVDAQLMLQKHQALIIFRVTDAGDGILGTQPLGNQAAQHVGFIAGCGGNQNVRPFHTGVQQGLGVGTVALDAQHVQVIFTALEHFFIRVQYNNVVILLCQMLRQGMPDFAVSHDENTHGDPPSKNIIR